MRRFSVLALTACLVAGGVVVAAEPWAQWRGANRDGASQEKGLRTSWPDNAAPAPRWSADVGVGYSSMAVADGRLYTLGWRDGNETVHCLDAATGKPVWTHSYPVGKWDRMHEGGSSSTPAVDSGKVYTLSREGHFHCLDAKTGKVVWSHPLANKVGTRPPQWGFSGSPLVVGDTVYIDIAKIVALDKNTGEIKWQTKDFGGGYSSPVRFTQGGKDFLATFPGAGLVILNPADGAVVATHNWKTNYDVNAATPLVIGNQIFISSGYGVGAALLNFDGQTLSPVWTIKDMRNHMASSVAHDGYLYGFDEGLLRCLDLKTGESKWSERGLGKGSLILADGHLFILSERGELIVAPAKPDGFAPTGRANVFPNSGSNWCAPILANKTLYLRNQRGPVQAFDLSAK